MRVATCNVQNTPDMSRGKVIRCGQIMREKEVDIVGFQEIREEGEDYWDVQRGLGRGYKMRVPFSTPIAVNEKKFKVVGDDFFKFHSASGTIPTPMRGASSVSVRRRWGTAKVVVVNCHMINGGFNDAHLDTKDRRRELWHKSKDVLEDVLQVLYAEGYNVIVLGDFNRVHFFLRVGVLRVDWVTGDNDIDKIGVLAQPGMKFVVDDKFDVETPSDHHAKVVDMRLLRQ